MKSFVRSLCGLSKKSAGGASSIITPSSKKSTRSATSRANPISCVTTSIVMPECASSRITSRTSEIISGSNALVGSSKSMIFGSIAKARAMATRCCCPPDISAGNLCAWSLISTRSSNASALASASLFGIFFTRTGPNVMFCRFVRCGNRLNCWNTMPTSRRMRSMLRRSLVSSMPSTIIEPR